MPPIRERDDEALLATSHLDASAFAALVERYDARFRRYLARRMAPADVDDALSELWETAFRRRHAYRPERGPVVGWLFGIARNVTHHSRRRSSRARRLTERLEWNDRRDAGSDPADDVVRAELVDRLEAAMAELPSHEREVVELIVIDGCSYDRAADSLGVPVGTVRSRLSRARSKLRTG